MSGCVYTKKFFFNPLKLLSACEAPFRKPVYLPPGSGLSLSEVTQETFLNRQWYKVYTADECDLHLTIPIECQQKC